jgi:alpha,alpha-trehalase
MANRLLAAIFDLDGVITFTARVHAAAWKELFDSYLGRRAEQLGESFQPFDIETDYRRYVDGKPRSDGIVSFLGSRSISIPLGTPSDPFSADTVHGLGNRKNEFFKETLRVMGVDVDHKALKFVEELRSRNVRTGLATSSKNGRAILAKAAIAHLFDAVVDGVVSEQLGLRGKPEPDIFLECLSRLGTITPQSAAVVEDAISGVEAGKKGGFGAVLGVDRHNRGDLKQHGADWVISDFTQITGNQFIESFTSMTRAA